MGGHDHGHHEPYKVPDYKIYKVEDIPQLLTVKRALAAQGLSDPWLRNEVWRYNPKVFGTEGLRTRKTFLRGLGLGLVAAVVTIVGSTVYDKLFPSKHHGHSAH